MARRRFRLVCGVRGQSRISRHGDAEIRKTVELDVAYCESLWNNGEAGHFSDKKRKEKNTLNFTEFF